MIVKKAIELSREELVDLVSIACECTRLLKCVQEGREWSSGLQICCWIQDEPAVDTMQVLMTRSCFCWKVER
jgi:hypothetical protein